jgi:hypothetical protein
MADVPSDVGQVDNVLAVERRDRCRASAVRSQSGRVEARRERRGRHCLRDGLPEDEVSLVAQARGNHQERERRSSSTWQYGPPAVPAGSYCGSYGAACSSAALSTLCSTASAWSRRNLSSGPAGSSVLGSSDTCGALRRPNPKGNPT